MREHDSRTRERWIVWIAVLAIVLWRSAVFAFWEQSYFDADQAVVGLMAKHLAEGRAFPLFFYGQNYMLGVEAWMAAPMFLLFGVSVAALKLPLLLINAAVALLLVGLLEREIGLRPMLAAIATLPFLLPAPGTAAHLVDANGGNLEPFLYVTLMWITRTRPGWCGLIFGIGFLQREFTLYGLAALLCVQAAEGSLFSRAGIVRLGRLLRAAAEVWLVVQVLRLQASAAGPGTTVAALYRQPANNILELAARTCIQPGTLTVGVARLLTQHWPQLLGTAPYALADFGIESRASQGLPFAWVLPATAVLLAAIRVLWHGRERNRPLATSFVAFLLLVGVFSALGYVAGRCGEVNFNSMRYELLSLLGIAGLGAWFLRVESSRRIAHAWVACVVLWAALSGTAHVRLWAEYLRQPPIGAKRQVMRALEARGIHYGYADYWMAYYITFLSNERIILASSDLVRIRIYEDMVAAHAAEAVRIARQPCGGRELVRGVYLCE